MNCRRTGYRAGWLCVSLLLCAALGVVSGCGNGTETSTNAPPETSPKASKRPHLIVPGRLPARFRREGCISALASVGPRPGLITISVHCVDPRKTEEEEFSIERYIAAHPLMTPAIVGYTQEPRVVARGSEAQSGQCQRRTEAVSCSVPVTGSKKVQVKIWVPPRTTCSAGVLVGVNRSGTCSPEPCIRSLLIYSVFRGKPRGC